MSVGTTLIEFKTALVDALTARAGLAGVQVSYGFPDDEVTDEAIWIQDANGNHNIPTYRAGPAVKVEEQYTVTVACQVLMGEGAPQQDADARAAELLAEVQQAVAENPVLIPTILHAQLSGWRHHVGLLPTGGGHGSRFDVQVQVRARLHP